MLQKAIIYSVFCSIALSKKNSSEKGLSDDVIDAWDLISQPEYTEVEETANVLKPASKKTTTTTSETNPKTLSFLKGRTSQEFTSEKKNILNSQNEEDFVKVFDQFKKKRHGKSHYSFQNQAAQFKSFTVAPRGPPLTSVKFTFKDKRAKRKCFCTCPLA